MDEKWLEEIKIKCDKIIISGLLDGEPYDYVKEYILALESEIESRDAGFWGVHMREHIKR